MFMHADVFPCFSNMDFIEQLWDNHKILKLIKLYQSQRVIWDTSSEDYKNKVKKNEAWENIAKDMGIARKDVESKMHSLRSQFARERKRMLTSKTEVGASDTDRPSRRWIFYNALKFLLDVMSNSVCTETVPKRTYDRHFSKADELPLRPSTSTSTRLMTSNSPQHSTPLNSEDMKKRKMDDDINDMYDFIKSAKLRKDEPKDEFDIYGQYVASELRAAKNEFAVLQAKSLINNILIEARLGRYDNEGIYETAYHYSRDPGYETASTASAGAKAQGPVKIEVTDIESESSIST